jgi:hypothetical protein
MISRRIYCSQVVTPDRAVRKERTPISKKMIESVQLICCMGEAIEKMGTETSIAS